MPKINPRKWYLQIKYQEWVSWQYSDNKIVTINEPATLKLGKFNLDFELPPNAVELKRFYSWAWRFNNPSGPGMNWNFCKDPNEAKKKAKEWINKVSRYSDLPMWQHAIRNARIDESLLTDH